MSGESSTECFLCQEDFTEKLDGVSYVCVECSTTVCEDCYDMDTDGTCPVCGSSLECRGGEDE